MTKFDPTRPVQTCDGRPARIICTDRHGEKPIISLVNNYGEEVVYSYYVNGSYAGVVRNPLDLVNVHMPSDEYVAKKGIICPVCGTDNISGGGTDFYEGGMTQGVSCDECGAEWVDDYVLAGYSNLEINGEDGE